MYILLNKKDSGIIVKGNIVGWDDNKNNLRLDYIFFSYFYEVVKFFVIFNGIVIFVIFDYYGVEIVIF